MATDYFRVHCNEGVNASQSKVLRDNIRRIAEEGDWRVQEAFNDGRKEERFEILEWIFHCSQRYGLWGLCI